MTDTAVAPETPDVAETVSFLRRFAEMMANGYNGAYLRRAADLLEGLTAQAISASDEEGLWQDKYETTEPARRRAGSRMRRAQA